MPNVIEGSSVEISIFLIEDWQELEAINSRKTLFALICAKDLLNHCQSNLLETDSRLFVNSQQ